MKLIADLQKGTLEAGNFVFPVTNKTRTLRDGTRQSYEVIRSIPDNLPYDPQPFPKGLWKIMGIQYQKEKGFDPKTYGPVKIITDAWQWVNVWDLDNNGDYYKETELVAQDHGYLLHYSTSSSTLGCIRLNSPEDALKIAEIIQANMPVQLEVI